MKRVTLLILAIIVIAPTICLSQKIHIKKNFFTGWKYSFDQESWHKVGIMGTDLCFEMTGNEEALKEMEDYRSLMIVSTIFGSIGGVLLGWPIGATIGNGEWNDSYTDMMIGSACFITIGYIFESIANSQIRNAINIYNSENQDLTFGVGLQSNLEKNNSNLYLNLKIIF